MRLVWRRIGPDEFNHELVWLVVSIAAAVGGITWLSLGLPTMRCPFLAMTGYPCLTCGATRCSIAFAHANFGAALAWNPLATIVLCGLALFNVYALIVLLARLPRLRIVAWTQ